MKLNDQVILNLRLEALRLAAGDVNIATNLMNFLTAETPAEADERMAEAARVVTTE